ncbi:MAG TPA: glycosyltransferase [Candidatus Hydrogenedentes bacterium]|nr:glycosyltransferase [Candidatus Hydrogenedentota bacterium]
MNVLSMGIPFGTADTPLTEYRSRRGHEVRTLGVDGTAGVSLNASGQPFLTRLDYAFAPVETADAVIARIARDWPPDLLLCWMPEMFPPPRAIEQCPIKTVAVVSDWNIYYPQLEYNLSRYDVVVTDKLGSIRLTIPGVTPRYLGPVYSQLSTVHRRLDIEKDIDVAFAGNLNHAIHRDRGRVLEVLAGLADRYRIAIRYGVYGEEYARLFNRSRIVLNYAVRQEMNLRCFEATACNALLFIGDDNLEVPEYLRDREEVVLYREDNLAALIEHYLGHPEETARITCQGHARALELAGENRLDDLLDALAAEPMGRRGFDDLPEETRALADVMEAASSMVPGQREANSSRVRALAERYPDRPAFLVAHAGDILADLAGMATDQRGAAVKEAIGALRDACALREDCVVLWHNLAYVCRCAGAIPLERRCFETALDADSTEFGGLLFGAFSDPYYAAWRRALGLHEERPEILWAAAAVHLSEIFLQEGRAAEARTFADKSIECMPDVAWPYRARAIAESYLGQLDAAADTLEAGLAHTAFDAIYRMDLVRAWRALGRLDEARRLAEDTAVLFSCYPNGEPHEQAFRQVAEAIAPRAH